MGQRSDDNGKNLSEAKEVAVAVDFRRHGTVAFDVAVAVAFEVAVAFDVEVAVEVEVAFEVAVEPPLGSRRLCGAENGKRTA